MVKVAFLPEASGRQAFDKLQGLDGAGLWEDGGGTWKRFADFSFLLKSSSRGSDPPTKWSPKGVLVFSLS